MVVVVVVVGDDGLWCWVVVVMGGGRWAVEAMLGGGDGCELLLLSPISFRMKPQLSLYVELGEMLGEGFSQVVSEAG
ncbi:hypothetical protein Tco_1382608 [Tanacetum coccineum]